MKELELLELELLLLADCIARVKQYREDKKNYRNVTSLPVGELKHRLTALKQRMTLASKITTSDLWD